MKEVNELEMMQQQRANLPEGAVIVNPELVIKKLLETVAALTHENAILKTIIDQKKGEK